ncbi:MAG: hypothetical protein UT53_C0024G0004 [Candidatus Yanofskybacteria bacterium GW2011_GWD2_39_48]|uniref:Uncharacterized protein n=1 Tax=Candidatus Yanofskybacteria bacterium GW2011_GWD2_39_48 TaxID=1619031 RepID=A0A0G0PDV0_9BACT|nr:MAG: hypothetical protein UT53_C0024G0004 [Candidatus Yanofskybacteria bacterium GW2011_GWD2_39_48]
MEPKIEIPKRIEKKDIEALPIDIGGTEIILERHGIYERNRESFNVGSLTEEGAAEVTKLGEDFFRNFFKNIPESERKEVDVLIIGSDTQYLQGGRRSMETADLVMQCLKKTLVDLGLSEDQVLNTSKRFSGEGGVRPEPLLREPQIFENSWNFVQFLKEKYGNMGKEFWIAFEEDIEKEKRIEMGAEGPDEIADRLKQVVSILSRYARMYHKNNPGRRLVIWAATHYDTISPFVKRGIFGVGKEVPLGVDYGAGISIGIDSAGNLTTRIDGQEHTIQSPKQKEI